MSIPIKHGFLCIDHDPIEEWSPDDPSYVNEFIDVYLGPDNSPSGEYFTINVLTYSFMKTNNIRPKYAVILEEYSWLEVVKRVDEILQSCEGDNWDQMCDQLRKHMHWEYEGMK